MDKQPETVPLDINSRFQLYGREWKVTEVKIDETRRNAYSGYPRLLIVVEAVQTEHAPLYGTEG